MRLDTFHKSHLVRPCITDFNSPTDYVLYPSRHFEEQHQGYITSVWKLNLESRSEFLLT